MSGQIIDVRVVWKRVHELVSHMNVGDPVNFGGCLLADVRHDCAAPSGSKHYMWVASMAAVHVAFHLDGICTVTTIISRRMTRDTQTHWRCADTVTHARTRRLTGIGHV